MTDRPRIPVALRAVACLFFASGVEALINTVLISRRDSIHIDLDLMGLPICVGLLRLNYRWHGWALVFTWISMLSALLVFLASLVDSQLVSLTLLGSRISSPSGAWLGVISAGVFGLMLWQNRVLMRHDVSRLFQPATNQPVERPAAATGESGAAAG